VIKEYPEETAKDIELIKAEVGVKSLVLISLEHRSVHLVGDGVKYVRDR